MPLLRRADEVVGAEAHLGHQIAERLAHLVGEGLWRQACRFRGLLDLLAVFVRAGEEMDVAPVKPHEASQHITGKRGVGVPDMGHVVHVVDRRSDVIGAA